MGLKSFLFGGGGFKGYKPSKESWESSNQMLGQKVGGLISKYKDPAQTAFGPKGPSLGTGGKSSWGFGNKTFTTPYEQYKFKAPDLSGKQSVFGQMLGRTGSEFLRQSRGATDQATRNMMRAGSYSPAAMKNLALQSQMKAQEGLEQMGEKGAFDIAGEQAKYDFETQKEQAGQGQLAKEFAQKGGQLALSGEELAQKGKTAEAELKLKDLLQNKDYLAKLLELYGQQQVLPYTAGQKQGGGGGGAFGSLLGGAAAGAMSLIP